MCHTGLPAIAALLAVLPTLAAAQVVHGDSGSGTVSLHDDTASMRLQTAHRAFEIALDSLTMAAWADTAVALRGPRPGTAETQYPAARLATSMVSIAIIRMSTDSSSPYVVAGIGYGGFGGRIVLPRDSAMRLFALMRAPALPGDRSADGPFLPSQVDEQAKGLPNSFMVHRTGGPLGEAAAMQGTAVIEFVVSATGDIEQGSYRVVSAPSGRMPPGFEEGFMTQRYIPARRHGRPVRVRLQEQVILAR